MQAKFFESNQNYEFSVLVEYQLMENIAFCCNKFKRSAKEFSLWDNNTGRFCVITKTENQDTELVPIDCCPFCGEKILYEKM